MGSILEGSPAPAQESELLEQAGGQEESAGEVGLVVADMEGVGEVHGASV